MDLSTYSLKNDYTIYTPFSSLYKLPIEHGKKIFEGSLGSRVIHFLIAFTEALPLIGQIASLAERLIMKNYYRNYPEKLRPQPPLPMNPATPPAPPTQGQHQGARTGLAEAESAAPIEVVLGLSPEDAQQQRAALIAFALLPQGAGVAALGGPRVATPPPVIEVPQDFSIEAFETTPLSEAEAAELRLSDERLVTHMTTTLRSTHITKLSPITGEHDRKGGDIYLGISGLMAICEGALNMFPIRTTARLIAVSSIHSYEKFRDQYGRIRTEGGEDSVINLRGEDLAPLLRVTDETINPDLHRYFNLVDRLRSQGHAIVFDFRVPQDLTKQFARLYLCHKVMEAKAPSCGFQQAMADTLRGCYWGF